MKQVHLPPLPQGVPETIDKVLASNLTPEAKAELVKQIVNEVTKIYNDVIARYEAQGKNVRDVVFQALTLLAAITAAIFGASQ